MTFENPNINVNTKSNEQNVQIIKIWAMETVNRLNSTISNLESRIAALESTKEK